ncbi:MAG: NUDIX domain-containing protein [Candidatus Gottesmanbacteria bacterium]|nr:NUDIX domain-containing protein [Candidatus Gottesmanbacteria bacterium]
MNRNIAVTLECFIHKDGKYLMLHRDSGKRIMPGVLMAPGGKREFNEGLFACARREVFEETGLRIKNLRIKATGNAYLRDLDQEFYFHFVFADYDKGNVLENCPEGRLVWLTPSEIFSHDKVLAEIKLLGNRLFSTTKEVLSYTAVYTSGNMLESFTIEAP